MTGRADFHMDIALGRTRLKCVAAGASYLGCDVLWMNISFHESFSVKIKKGAISSVVVVLYQVKIKTMPVCIIFFS
jgi:hypothetical protein